MLLIVGLVSPTLAIAGIPAFAAMMIAGFGAAFILGIAAHKEGATVATSTFRNPFSLVPALKFGVVFTAVLFVARAAKFYLGYDGQMAVAAISGLVDVDAISLTLAGFVNAGSSSARDAVIGMTLAAGVNAIFKGAIARTSHQPAFYLRLMAGFVTMFAVGAATIMFIDPLQVVDLANRLQTK
jgi:uncharacterized membrane protein (DUF4010 family)